MRDRYLFRGKRTDSGEWVYGLLGRYNADYENANIIDEFECLVPVKTKTVGQYTGLTDKNGKKIFENGYIIIDNKTYKVTFNNAEYILTNIFNCDIITLKNNSIRGVFVDEI